MTSSDAGERPRTPYTRFIPREELEGVTVRMPGRLGTAFDQDGPGAQPTRPWQPLDGAAETPAALRSASAKVAGLATALRPGTAVPDLSLDDGALPGAAHAAAAPAARSASAAFAARVAQSAPPAPSAPSGAAHGEDLLAAALAAAAQAQSQAQSQAQAQMQAEADARMAEMQARVDALEAEVAAARQAGYQDGYRDGLVALDSFKSSYAQQVTAQVGQVLQSLDGELRQLEQNAAASLARVAIALARQVVRHEIATRPAQVMQVAEEAVNAVMTGARHITVKLHPDDHALVAQGCADLLDARGARLVAEPSVERGGCLVDTEAGGVDARVATRWAAVMQTMGSAAPWHADEAPESGA
ncbi:flagellar assembly protein FliH [Ideonella sp. DXS22W]|uniref:Flagellar assembly protein FliH n=1 Tax=Pseudaquabacterium inlustre TaxID=2984192 RepID=A0ABU9CAP9_9BURK